MEPDEPRAGDSEYDIRTKAARSTGTLIVQVPVDEVVRVVDELSRKMRQPRLLSLTTSGAEFDRRMNFWTWGMRITLKFRLLRSDQTLIWARCTPKVRSTVWDWGQGASDLRAVLGAIDRQISEGRRQTAP